MQHVTCANSRLFFSHVDMCIPRFQTIFIFLNPSQSRLGTLYYCTPGTRIENNTQSIKISSINNIFVGELMGCGCVMWSGIWDM